MGDQCLEIEETSFNLEDLLTTSEDVSLTDNALSPSSDYGSLGEGVMSTGEEDAPTNPTNLSLLDDLDLTAYLTGMQPENSGMSTPTAINEQSCDQDIEELMKVAHDSICVNQQQSQSPENLIERRMTTRQSTGNIAEENDSDEYTELLKKPVKSAYTEDWASQDIVERNRKNAIQARINRQKKKKYLQGLEEQVNELSEENKELKEENASLSKDKAVLEEEVEYLKNVLANESQLASLLQNINGLKSVRLSTSFRRSSVEVDHDYQKPAKRRRVTKATASGGVCLHVENKNVSLEFCSKCARMANGARKDGKS